MALCDKRRRANVIYLGLCYAATALGLSWLVIILFELIVQGFNGLSFSVFTQMTPPPGQSGGLLNESVVWASPSREWFLRR
ncbi:hypothetical protein [Methylocapsa palsarum]|uniref:Phosphate transport system permease protein n=1 Tax=Methylocapsa palsarum TaxID=1612308 RepID=A0A1I4B6V8_9HYPH|nr:hypothetical protein [Methylocapsa palsarum]SFK64494.1 phosphate transport system permease protein [Methylocapsa palsarum]